LAGRAVRRNGAHYLSELSARPNLEQKMTTPKMPAAGPDITIAYAGAVIMVAPCSQVGCEWLSSDRPVPFALRDLDTVLK
jgi:hypothetical protein